jgi:biotin carboxyl carrier protein
VGYFKASDAMVKVGDIVKEGDKIGEVVALGLANDVTAKEGGQVAEVCVVDGDSVEFGQRILVLRK